MKHFSLFLASVLALGTAVVVAPCKLQAQAEPGATRAGAFQVGGALSFLKPEATGYLYPDNTPTKAPFSIGGAGYGSFDFGDLGIIAEVQYPTARTPDDFLEKSYLAGARYVFHYRRRYSPYVKVLAGLGQTSYDRPVAWITFPSTPSSYGIIAYGAGLDYALTRRINLRPIDIEFQHWGGYPGGSINPLLIEIGAAYRFR